MTDTDKTAANQGELTALRLPELRKIAGELGLKGTSGLRKGELINAISSARSGGNTSSAAPAAKSTPAPAAETAPEETPARRGRRRVTASPTTPSSDGVQQAPQAESAPAPAQEQSHDENDGSESSSQDGQDNQDNRFESRSAARRARRNRQRQTQRDTPETEDSQDSAPAPQAQTSQQTQVEQEDNTEQSQGDQNQQDSHDNRRGNQRRDRRGNRNDQRDNQQDQSDDQQDSQDNDTSHNDRRGNRNDDHGDDRRGRRGRRNRRGRDNRQDNRDNRGDHQNEQNDNQQDDQLQNVAGILDIVDTNVAFVRTTGYHPAPSDVFVNNQLIRRMGLRSGDAIVGQVRMNQGGHQGGNQGGRNRQKYNNLSRVDSINGLPVEETRNRPEFNKLTPLYPNQRLRLETEPRVLTTRVIDLIMPIGKGQRALIVSPPKAGKTTILQNIANAIATNNPECYLMVVLVDERPEEVTDMQRSVKGEVIASTFDRPPGEHTAIAELAIERAKRLVEQGQDVVVLLDSITRLGRAYNNSSPASGRILSGGVDSNALYPPKRFLGAARNIENGGSLTIIATAMVETGSAGDTVIFEEFKGTGNAELKLDRKISERRVFPAVDVNPSGTRKDELLLNPDEARIMHKLRRILSALDNQQAIDLLIKQLKKTKSNAEFLMQVASSAPMAATENDEEYS